MEERELLIALGDKIGHAELLQALRDINPSGGYAKQLADANEMDGPCVGREGQCGECRDGVWYPCTIETEPEV